VGSFGRAQRLQLGGRTADERGGIHTQFKDTLTTDPQLKVDVQREPDYYAAQVQTADPAHQCRRQDGGDHHGDRRDVSGALNSMYFRGFLLRAGWEIATLRAIGFRRPYPVLLSVMIEALPAVPDPAASSAASTGLAVLSTDTASARWGALSPGGFPIDCHHPALIITGIVWACIIGLLGGFFPRAARR